MIFGSSLRGGVSSVLVYRCTGVLLYRCPVYRCTGVPVCWYTSSVSTVQNTSFSFTNTPANSRLQHEDNLTIVAIANIKLLFVVSWRSRMIRVHVKPESLPVDREKRRKRVDNGSRQNPNHCCRFSWIQRYDGEEFISVNCTSSSWLCNSLFTWSSAFQAPFKRLSSAFQESFKRLSSAFQAPFKRLSSVFQAPLRVDSN